MTSDTKMKTFAFIVCTVITVCTGCIFVYTFRNFRDGILAFGLFSMFIVLVFFIYSYVYPYLFYCKEAEEVTILKYKVEKERERYAKQLDDLSKMNEELKKQIDEQEHHGGIRAAIHEYMTERESRRQ